MEQLTLTPEEAAEILRLPTKSTARIMMRFYKLRDESSRFAQLIDSLSFPSGSLGESLQKVRRLGRAGRRLERDCACLQPHALRGPSADLGRDETKGRFGDVSIQTCEMCGVKWLCYRLEYEHVTASGRWFRGVLPSGSEGAVVAENAIAILESLEWYLRGGTVFKSSGERASGMVFDHP